MIFGKKRDVFYFIEFITRFIVAPIPKTILYFLLIMTQYFVIIEAIIPHI